MASRTAKPTPARGPGRPAKVYSQATRLFRLYRFLSAHGRITKEDLAQEFEVSTKTIERDIAALQEDGVYVDIEHDELNPNVNLYLLTAGDRENTIRLNDSEMTALLLALGLFDDFTGTELATSLHSLEEKLRAGISRERLAERKLLESQFYVVPEGRKAFDESADDALNEVLTALLGKRPLTFHYTSSAGTRSRRRRVDPLTLALWRHGLYLVGKEHPDGALRIYAVERIKDAERVRDARVVKPEGYDPREFFANSFGIWGTDEAPTLVRIRFAAGAAQYVKARTWHESQTIESEKDGAIILSMQVQVTPSLRSWVLEWGRAARVLEPASLRDEVVTELREALAAYT